jgi:hypothetical protein
MKEADIRPARVHERYLTLTQKDTKTFFADHEGWAECPCPRCGGDRAVPAFTKHGFPYVECAACASLYVPPRPPRSALDRFYRDAPSSRYWAQEFFPAVEEARREKIIRPRVRRILDDERVRRLGLDRPLVVDVGAGSGVFLTELLETNPGGAPSPSSRERTSPSRPAAADYASSRSRSSCARNSTAKPTSSRASR